MRRVRRRTALWIAVGSLLCVSELPAAASEAPPLSLGEVLEAAIQRFPLLEAARLERNVRGQQLRSARGAFDTRLSADATVRPEGFYENTGVDALLEQPTTLWGTRFYAGYRYGEGDFPSYLGGSLTDESGELRLGLEVPLLRDGAIDERRGRIAKARLDLERVDPELGLQSVELVRDATLAYWGWVAAGLRVDIARSLLTVANDRQSQIAGRVERGSEPRIDLVDNRRLVVERMALLRGAERDFEQAAIRLSLFHRDEEGEPIRVDPIRLPQEFPEESLLEDGRVERDLDFALDRHPILRRLAIEQRKLEVELRLARNRMLPELDVIAEGSRDFGQSQPGIDEVGKLSTDPRSDDEVKVALRLALPIQQRDARGRVGAAKARLAQIERRARYARDRVVADIQLSLEALEAAYDQTAQARENLELADELRLAEVRKLELGLSNLIDVNIREVQAATAARQLIDAQRDYFFAVARYEARIARPL